MRSRALLSLIFLSAAFPLFAAERLSNGYTQHPDAFFRAGFWWDQDDPGWGIDLHMSGEVMVGTWATYDESGRATWYLGVGEAHDGAWHMPLDRYTRTASGTVVGEPAGELRLSFASADQATMAWTLGERSGSYQIQPFIVSDSPIAEDRTGFWFETAHPGYGMSIVTQREYVMSVFLFYDQAGAPRWVWADNIGAQDRERLQALSFTGTCPGCAPMAPTSSAAGAMQMRFESENDATLSADLRVDDEEDYGWQLEDARMQLLSNRASGRDQPFRLMPFASAQTLEAYLKAGLVDPGPHPYPWLVEDGPVFSGGGGGTSTISATNLQEQGVDEADVVKTDGNLIYALDQQTSNAEPGRIRIMQLGEAPALAEIAAIELPVAHQQVNGFYLLTDRADAQPDLLVVSQGSLPYYAFDIWFSPPYWTEASSRVLIYDIDDPLSARLLADIELDGGTVESRRVGETLYLITRFQPDREPVFSADSTAELESVLEQLTLDELLPAVHINGERHALVDPSRTLLPPQPPGYRYTDLVTISAFDLTAPTQAPVNTTFAGFAETVYVSEDNVFVASSRFASSIDPGFNVLLHDGRLLSDIHQFSLGEQGPASAYAGSGVVEGFISWGGTSPSFSFSEHDGHLRVVSTAGQMWQDTDHRVSVLRLAHDDNDVLQLQGTAPNAQRPERLGKPGEMLYGLRFLGDRLYAVTFKNIDPLYVVDLAQPRDPKILGEIEVTGFSDYLHPLPNDLLLGFGKEALPAEGPADGNFAWYQGLQLSLFDVSEPQTPRLIRRVEIGRRGSDSPLLSDHHAFSYLPPDVASGRPARVAIPVVIHDAADGWYSASPSHRYDWQATGLAMFDIDGVAGGAPDLALRDVLVARAADQHPSYPSYLDTRGPAGRGIIDAEHAYFYLRGDFYTAPWGLGAEVDGPF